MSRTAEELLQFDRLLEILARFTTCGPGRRAVAALVPHPDREALEAEFALVREAIAYLRAGEDLGFGALADTEGWLKRLGVPAAVLGSGELLDAASLLDAATGLKAVFRSEAAKYPRLAERAASLGDFRSLAAMIRRAILPNGEISDNASPELRRLRGVAAQTREKIQQSLQSILRARGETAGEDYVTLRNDRFVIPVRASDRRAVPGVVHGASATGQTVFVEPLATIDMNNRLVQLAEDEAVEIARILTELTERLRLERGPLAFAAATVAELDSVFARARFAREFDATLPEFSVGSALFLEAARNPVLEDTLRRQGRSAVPVSLALGGESADSGTVMVISGPNTGGKTVALKTVGLAALSGLSGIPVTAARAELPLFDRVLADIGDEQSITADLSTFSAHMLNLKRMLETATGRTLVLVDEMGTGTAPEEGAALAVALLEEFRTRRSLTLATTHHDRLKAYASTTPGIVNAAVEFDEVNLRPTYRLLVGVPGVSSGIEIARRLGLPAAVVERARAGLSPETREARGLIAYLHRSRDEVEDIKRQAREELERLEAERRALQTEWVERQRKRLAELEKRFDAMLKQLQGDVARLTAEIADRKERALAEKQGVRRLGKIGATAREEADAAVLEHLSASQSDLGVTAEAAGRPVAPERLVEGARVRVRGMKQAVIFRRKDGRSAEVEAGPLRMKVALSDILGIEEPGAAASATVGPASRGVTVHARPTEEPSAEEINVIGCTVEEATRRVDKFLDDAALASLPSIRIVHGHGTGALRRGLAEFLAAHPLVEGIHAEAEDRGGAAITIVELRG
ncbi:MAG TPA: Smr/MutS family protein [Candidatus Acidoferrales bacterium]|nr:Smr/MutS family protein [Candidatus Acidoferrales bacterium]